MIRKINRKVVTSTEDKFNYSIHINILSLKTTSWTNLIQKQLKVIILIGPTISYRYAQCISIKYEVKFKKSLHWNWVFLYLWYRRTNSLCKKLSIFIGFNIIILILTVQYSHILLSTLRFFTHSYSDYDSLILLCLYCVKDTDSSVLLLSLK